MNLLPAPRHFKPQQGFLRLPNRAYVALDDSLPTETAAGIANRLHNWSAGFRPGANVPKIQTRRVGDRRSAQIIGVRSDSAPNKPDGYNLRITLDGLRIEYRETGGLRAAVATLRQLLREYGRRLPCLEIRDWPDCARRGVMLDISRGRVPKLQTLLDLADKLADFKINELQLYTEHTFTYRRYKSVWQGWGALTPAEIRRLDERCGELGIDLVPNQNSFGHLRQFLEHPQLRKLAEVSKPYEDAGGGFVRRPSTLAPKHPGTLPFLRGLYDELLPNFSSRHFNVGCDETWDLGLGQSKALCKRHGKGRVYVDFLKAIHREVSKRGRTMMFWGDIILKHPNLIPELAGLREPGLIALNWGYEAGHPFDHEARLFAKSGIPFYVCPGTSTWQTLVGRHDNAFANLRAAAAAGRKHGALGYLITDWGDGGHPQPLAVSWPPYAFGAGVAWCANSFDENKLATVLSRDVFHDTTERAVKSALALGRAHLKLRLKVVNETPLGTVIAAPQPDSRELFCRHGLKHHERISAKNIRSTRVEIRRQLEILKQSRSVTPGGLLLARELRLAAQMAEFSCGYMLWQQSVKSEHEQSARNQAIELLDALRTMERDYNALWRLRNKATPRHSSAFLKRRRNELVRWLRGGS
ncbi:MAG TPA: glycoside hydrolase family 20 zincin-like fold domain-containing protein [Verrucomicrobiota bacterium]|nr:glycoside hydrolase family 20 zincin-like fold domain-containing protein [Verrucomicrobiota bacterium]